MQLGRKIVFYETKDQKRVEYERQSGHITLDCLLMEGATDDLNSFLLC
jgi:hypothetical protein